MVLTTGLFVVLDRDWNRLNDRQIVWQSAKRVLGGSNMKQLIHNSFVFSPKTGTERAGEEGEQFYLHY